MNRFDSGRLSTPLMTVMEQVAVGAIDAQRALLLLGQLASSDVVSFDTAHEAWQEVRRITRKFDSEVRTQS